MPAAPQEKAPRRKEKKTKVVEFTAIQGEKKKKRGELGRSGCGYPSWR